jgi:hypothetical protein
MVQLLDLNSANQQYLPTIFQPLAFRPPLFQSQFPGSVRHPQLRFRHPQDFAFRHQDFALHRQDFSLHCLLLRLQPSLRLHQLFLTNFQCIFRDSSVVGQNCQRAHFPCPPPPQNSMRSLKQNNNFSSLIVGCIIDPRPGLSTLSIDPFVSCVTHWCTIYNHYSTLLFFNHV